jgi:hypothetical protein
MVVILLTRKKGEKKTPNVCHKSRSISTGAQYVTPARKMYCEKVKMCWFNSGNWFFCTKFVQLAVAGERCNTIVYLQKKCNKLDLTAAQYF